MKLTIPGLYFVTPTVGDDCIKWLHMVEMAVLGGVTMVQIRDKISHKDTILNATRRLHPFLKQREVPLIINDYIDIALKSGVDGVHIGQRDGSVAEARKALGPNAIVGVSLERREELVTALGADYIAISPLFRTMTKTDTAGPWGLNGLKELRNATPLPIVAIGGINQHNVAEVRSAGADIIAVVTAIANAPCPREAAYQLCPLRPSKRNKVDVDGADCQSRSMG